MKALFKVYPELEKELAWIALGDFPTPIQRLQHMGHNNLWIKTESFHERAAFELACSINSIEVKHVEGGTWTAKGCERLVTYQLSCDEELNNCEWEQGSLSDYKEPTTSNTQATPNETLQ